MPCMAVYTTIERTRWCNARALKALIALNGFHESLPQLILIPSTLASAGCGGRPLVGLSFAYYALTA